MVTGGPAGFNRPAPKSGQNDAPGQVGEAHRAAPAVGQDGAGHAEAAPSPLHSAPPRGKLTADEQLVKARRPPSLLAWSAKRAGSMSSATACPPGVPPAWGTRRVLTRGGARTGHLPQPAWPRRVAN